MTPTPIKPVPGIVILATDSVVCITVAFAIGVLLWGIGVRIGLVAW